MNEPTFWNDHKHAAEASKRLSEFTRAIDTWERLLKDTEESLELAREDLRNPTVTLIEELREQKEQLTSELNALEFTLFFNGPYDSRNVILGLHAGTGGTEAMDWVVMLIRMYERFCQRHGFQWRVLDEHRGEVAGYKRLTASIQGSHAYGWLKGEAGTHRLVRISPFDAEQMRHTSFALVDVLPELETIEHVPIDPKELRIDTFLSSGHGGQSVQTTYSAVRVVHLPTGITVSCQNERSQQQNKETAMGILQAKLLQRKIVEQKEERRALRGDVVSANWGSQIRSYVLQPYKLVKDHRTGYEVQDPDRVLNGEFDDFVEHYLEWLKGGA